MIRTVLLPSSNPKECVRRMKTAVRTYGQASVKYVFTDASDPPKAELVPEHWCELEGTRRRHLSGPGLSYDYVEEGGLEFRTELEARTYLQGIRMPRIASCSFGVYECRSHYHIGVRS